MNRKKDYFCTTIKFIENPTQTHWMKHYRLRHGRQVRKNTAGNAAEKRMALKGDLTEKVRLFFRRISPSNKKM